MEGSRVDRGAGLKTDSVPGAVRRPGREAGRPPGRSALSPLLIEGTKRVVMIAPNVRAVRLRVSNPAGSNGGAIELESPPNAGWRQSIGATANERATLRCDRIAETAAAAGDHEVVLRVRNDVGPSECILTVRVADTAPAFPKAAVRARRLTVGTAASIAFDKATGGNGALTYALDAAPEGMAFDAAARTLSGTPGEAQARPPTPAPPRTRTATRRRRR